MEFKKFLEAMKWIHTNLYPWREDTSVPRHPESNQWEIKEPQKTTNNVENLHQTYENAFRTKRTTYISSHEEP